jgi:hypothetical protein
MWQQTAISVLTTLVGASMAASLAWWSFIRQNRRNSVMQVYLDAAQATYEAELIVALKLRGHLESLSAEKHEDTSKEFKSLIGRVGKLHLVASPNTMKAVNKFYDVLYDIYEGIIPDETFPTPTGAPIFGEMQETDVSTQIYRIENARIHLLTSMRKDLGYKMESRLIIKPKIKSLLKKIPLLKIKSLLKKISPLEREPLQIVHNSFTECFYSDLAKRDKALAAADDISGGLIKN